MAYLIVVEKTSTGFSAYSPDLPGCIATGATKVQTLRNMETAIEMHLDGLAEDGQKPPKPHASTYTWDRKTSRAKPGLKPGKKPKTTR